MLNNFSDTNVELYTESLSTQFRKGLLCYMVLLITQDPIYTSEILNKLKHADVNVAEGTIYPLLSRLQKDDLLGYEWHESDQGPPRKYYKITEYGRAVKDKLSEDIKSLGISIKTLERSK